MPQVSLYLDDETMRQLRIDAANAGLSLSKYVVMRLKEPSARYDTPNGLPEGYLDGLYARLSDDDSFARLSSEEQVGLVLPVE